MKELQSDTVRPVSNAAGRPCSSSILRWASSKEWAPGGLRAPLRSNHPLGHTASPEQEAKETESQDEEATQKRHRPDRTGVPEHRKPQKNRTSRLPECTASTECVTRHQQGSQIPLMLHIKVCGQWAGLGISVAGGRNSPAYRGGDEGVFISRVSRGCPAEKAGVHVGDRVLEVNGLDMRAVTHHEAVDILRTAGSCVKVKVLRERSVCSEARTQKESMDPEHSRHGLQRALKIPLLPQIQATVCNGNGMSYPEKDGALENDGSRFKNDTLQAVKSTMMVPRIVLTHPSTSDEDTEALSQELDDSEEVAGDGRSDRMSDVFLTHGPVFGHL